MLERSFFERDAIEVAAAMIGVELTLHGSGGIIVETEAYLADDPASHSFRGQTARNRSMWAAPGTAYVYHIYGMHWCLNAVCLPGSAVLIRALEPKTGLEAMRRRRGVEELRLLCSGPGRLAQALGIDRALDGTSMLADPFALRPAPGEATLVRGKRIGITRAADQPWRFGFQGSPFLSKKF